jgi:hypothetical protein
MAPIQCHSVGVQIEQAADELISHASRLAARATRRSMGRGLAAYLGLAPPSAAMKAASVALRQARREQLLKTKQTALNDAIIAAAIGAANAAGRDTAGVKSAWDDYNEAVAFGDRRRRKRSFQASRRAFRRGLGPLGKKWLIASIGANWALVSILTWDLAEDHGPYTPGRRDELGKPWISVAPFPHVAD